MTQWLSEWRTNKLIVEFLQIVWKEMHSVFWCLYSLSSCFVNLSQKKPHGLNCLKYFNRAWWWKKLTKKESKNYVSHEFFGTILALFLRYRQKSSKIKKYEQADKRYSCLKVNIMPLHSF